tara:strand:+ start:256 stop:411 length:156 start_codon:yes stop_codon:yes gene_type:complete
MEILVASTPVVQMAVAAKVAKQEIAVIIVVKMVAALIQKTVVHRLELILNS